MQFLLVLPARSRTLLRSSLAVRTGLWLYNHWAGGKRQSFDEVATLERQLDAGRQWSIYSYEDAQCEFPERLVAEWLAEAMAAGAVVRNHTTALEITRANGRVTGVACATASPDRSTQFPPNTWSTRAGHGRTQLPHRRASSRSG